MRLKPHLFAIVLTAVLGGVCPASAQMSASDLVMRLEALENQVRQLTGQIEQLQYRNQQLEQQVRAGGGMPDPARGRSRSVRRSSRCSRPFSSRCRCRGGAPARNFRRPNRMPTRAMASIRVRPRRIRATPIATIRMSS